jgi:hypothetical protein
MLMQMSTPFWWAGQLKDGEYDIIHSGTICLVDTGTRKIGVTANHVYEQYERDRAAHRVFRAQLGGAVVEPENHLIDRNAELDLATFDIPEVLAAPIGAYYHAPATWPPEPLQMTDVVAYGGFPEVMRRRRPAGAAVDFPFQYFAGRVNDVNPARIALHVGFERLHWPGHEGEQMNRTLSGQSGGPVYRVIDANFREGGNEVVDRVEVVGFIREYNAEFELMLATDVRHINADGRIVR